MNDLILKDDKGKKICILAYNNKTDEIDITINKPINFIINGNIGTEINGEVDVTVHGDTRIDTFLSKLFVNSYISKFIKDHPDSIEKQKEIELRIEKYNAWLKLNDKNISNFTKEYILKKE